MTTTQIDNDTGTGTGTDTEKGGRLAMATDKVKEKASAVRQTATETLGTARTKASDAYSAARERTSAAYGTARQNATRARARTSEGIESNPVGALVGGLALGALLAAVLPRTRREQQLLGDYGRRVSEKAKEAARAAKDAGRDKLDEMGLNKEAAKDKLSALASKAGEAVKTSAGAAARTVKSSETTTP